MKKLLLALTIMMAFATQGWCVVSSTINQNEYACNSSNTSWNYTFPIILPTDIYVYTIDSSGNVYPQTTNFSVNTSTQTVTYPVTGTPCATGYNLLLERIEPFTQQVAASNQGPAPSPVVMTMSDKLTMLAQQLQNSSIQTSPGTSGSIVFPPVIAGDLIGWNGSGVLANVSNPSAVAQWTLSGANISYNLGNVSTTNNMTAAQMIANFFNGELNGNINWPSVGNLLNSSNVNWPNVNSLANINSSGINWPNINTLATINSGAINWESINNVLPSTTNSILNETSTGGANWTSLGAIMPYVKVSETETSGTNGGTSTSGSWLARILNTKDSDTSSIASLCTGNGTPVATCTAANQVVLPAGTYIVHAVSPFAGASTNTVQIRLQNITGSSTLITGMSFSISGYVGILPLDGSFTLSSPSAVSIQYQVAVGSSTIGLGSAASFGTEVYTVAEFTKIK